MNRLPYVLVPILVIVYSASAQVTYLPPTATQTSIVSGALGVYLLDEGSGTTIHDSSGNSRDGAFCSAGAAPTWSAQGVTFNGSQCFTIPVAALNGAKTIQVWFNNRVMRGAQTNGSPAYMVVGNGCTLEITPNQWGRANLVNLKAEMFLDQLMGTNSIALVANSITVQTFTANQLFVNGTPGLGTLYLNGDVGTSWTSTSTASIGGLSTAPTSAGFLGDIYAVAIYSTALTQAQIGQNERAVRSILAQRGINFQNGDNKNASPLLFVGDSITFGTGVSNGALLSEYPYYAWTRLNETYVPYNLGISGLLASEMSTNLATTIQPIIYSYSGTQPVVYVEGGTNDIRSQSPATVYSTLQAICASVHTLKGKCVVQTVMPATIITGSHETDRQTLNSTIISGWLAGTINADAVSDVAGDPIMGLAANNVNTTYFLDGTHPTAAGNQIMGDIAALAIHSATRKRNTPYWLQVNVPFFTFAATASTTATVNLLQLGPNQQVCGVNEVVTTAFAGPSISALTATIGDSTGTATQYEASLNLLATGGQVNQNPNYLSVNGIVQGNFTATGANLSALTVGNLKVNICVVTQP